ncbi:MAG: hydrogenase maturation protease [Candidatus Korobacteraceae bacterium]
MSQRILIACVGNIFLGDDAFGVEVARVLAAHDFPKGVRVEDFGIRAFDLAYALLGPWDAVILVDAVPRGDVPGTLYTIEPDLGSIADAQTEDAPLDGHSMDPVKVVQLAQTMGSIPARLLIVGCEPADCGGEEGRMGLSEPVQNSVAAAADMVEELVGQIAGAKTG